MISKIGNSLIIRVFADICPVCGYIKEKAFLIRCPKCKTYSFIPHLLANSLTLFFVSAALLKYGLTMKAFLYSVIIVLLMIDFYTDLTYSYVNLIAILPLIPLYLPFAHRENLAGLLLFFSLESFSFILAKLKKREASGADILFMMAAGFIIGKFAIPAYFFISFLLIVYLGLLLALKRKSPKDYFPFIPIPAIVTILFLLLQ